MNDTGIEKTECGINLWENNHKCIYLKKRTFVLQHFPMIETKMSMYILVRPIRDHPFKLKIEKKHLMYFLFDIVGSLSHKISISKLPRFALYMHFTSKNIEV